MKERQRLSSDPGLPDRTIAEAQVLATLALAAATAVAALGPDSRAWADVAGTKFASGLGSAKGHHLRTRIGVYLLPFLLGRFRRLRGRSVWGWFGEADQDV